MSQKWRHAFNSYPTELLCYMWWQWYYRHRWQNMHVNTHTLTLAHTHKQPSISLVWMGRACCFDVGLDGARHLAYACWGKKEEAFISWRVFPIWQVKKKRVRICHIHAIIFRKNMLSNYAYIHNPLLHIYATYYTDLFSYTHARTPKSNRLHSHGHTPIYHSLQTWNIRRLALHYRHADKR